MQEEERKYGECKKKSGLRWHVQSWARAPGRAGNSSADLDVDVMTFMQILVSCCFAKQLVSREQRLN